MRKQTRIISITHSIQRLKWRWAGHISRSNKDKWLKGIAEWYKKKDRKTARQMDGLFIKE